MIDHVTLTLTHVDLLSGLSPEIHTLEDIKKLDRFKVS